MSKPKYLQMQRQFFSSNRIKAISTLEFLCMILALTLAPGISSGAERFIQKSNELAALANNTQFYSEDQCTVTSIAVYVFKDTNRYQSEQGPPYYYPNIRLYGSVDIYDQCTDTVLVSIQFEGNQIANQDFNIDNNLTYATLNTEVSAVDLAVGEYKNVSLNLAWTKTGALERSSFHSHNREQNGNVFNLNSKGIGAEASMSGTIAFDSKYLNVDIKDGLLSKNTNSQITILRQ